MAPSLEMMNPPRRREDIRSSYPPRQAWRSSVRRSSATPCAMKRLRKIRVNPLDLAPNHSFDLGRQAISRAASARAIQART